MNGLNFILYILNPMFLLTVSTLLIVAYRHSDAAVGVGRYERTMLTLVGLTLTGACTVIVIYLTLIVAIIFTLITLLPVELQATVWVTFLAGFIILLLVAANRGALDFDS